MNYFGTDGIRNKLSFFTETILRKIANAIVSLPDCSTVAIGRDTRIGGIYMENILTDELLKHGVNIYKFGILPSPALSCCTCLTDCDYAIMLSASHNPPEYNGIKLFEKSGKKLSEKNRLLIEELIRHPVTHPIKNATSRIIDGKALYLSYVKETFGHSLRGLNVLLDCACGAASFFAKDIFIAFGAKVTTCFESYCGKKINVNNGASHPETLKKLCSDNYDIGFSFDGDADRVITCVDGKIFNGDHMTYVAAKYLKSLNKLHKNTVVGTIMANSGVETAYLNSHIKFIRTDVGDSNVYKEMEKHGYSLGGEESGHVIFREHLKTGDGVMTALIMGSIHKRYYLPLCDDVKDIPSFSDYILADAYAKNRFVSDIRVKELISSFDNVRIIARPSGTEPKIRLTCESENSEEALKALNTLKSSIKEIIDDNKQNNSQLVP